MPTAVPSVATSFVFLFLFNPQLGLVNSALRRFGIQGPGWFSDPDWVIPTFVVMSLWTVGSSLPLYLAALSGVPKVLHEAIQVDGGNRWHELRHGTIPWISPVLLYSFILGIIGSLQVFTGAFIATQGGPSNASLFYVLYLYRNGWQYFDMGYASAMALVLFLIILTLTVALLVFSKHVVYYEFDDRK